MTPPDRSSWVWPEGPWFSPAGLCDLGVQMVGLTVSVLDAARLVRVQSGEPHTNAGLTRGNALVGPALLSLLQPLCNLRMPITAHPRGFGGT
jgi:hypothetical protein